MGLFKKITDGLKKTRENIVSNVEAVLKGFTKFDPEFYEELEEALIAADVGVNTSVKIIESLKETVKEKKLNDAGTVKDAIIEIISGILSGSEDTELILKSPAVILIIGVNGVGKTTTIGKLAGMYAESGKKVILAAADTFRAAAIDQLEVWGKRAGVTVIKHQENSDPGAVVFDAIAAAKARDADLLICDTAGRLHNKKNLMEELKKIYRIIEREYSAAQLEVFLILDATTGQNAVNQARLFGEIAELTGIVITKLDGTAKGGVIIAIRDEFKVPVRFICVGESLSDLQPFDPKEFAAALFAEETGEDS